MIYKYLTLASIILASITSASAQITIGATEQPINGALLQLKNRAEDSTGANATKGLVLPRVELTNKTNLYPMFESDGTGNYQVGSTIYTKTTEDQVHIGLLVYNVTKSMLFCPGLYAWNGTTWRSIAKCNPTLFTVTPSTPMDFWSGRNGMTITPQKLTLEWNPEDMQISYTSAPVAGFNPVIINDTSFSPSLSTRPNKIPLSFSPLPMAIADLENNPFSTNKSILTFKGEKDGEIIEQSLNVSQTNKAVTVNGTQRPVDKFYDANKQDNAIVQSNAKWKLSKILPENKPAVSSSMLNVEFGTEKEDGTANSPVSVPYDVKIGANYARYSYLVFSDAESPKRFSDVVLSVSQCSGNTDISLVGYRDIWETTYGLSSTPTPDTSGDVSRNTNETQWHYTNPGATSDNEIFFSAMFGTAGRWMTTNLATMRYPDRTDGSNTSSLPSLTYNYDTSYTNAYWGYPGANAQNFKDRERVGYLYNWYAAAAGKIDETTRVQGICSKGWHLPTTTEWNELMAYVKANPSKSSTYTSINNNTTFYAMKDKCERPVNEGKSFDILQGGFSFLLTGGFAGGASAWWLAESIWWTCTNSYATNADFVTFEQAKHEVILNKSHLKTSGFAVRCKKDN